MGYHGKVVLTDVRVSQLVIEQLRIPKVFSLEDGSA